MKVVRSHEGGDHEGGGSQLGRGVGRGVLGSAGSVWVVRTVVRVDRCVRVGGVRGVRGTLFTAGPQGVLSPPLVHVDVETFGHAVYPVGPGVIEPALVLHVR